MKRRDFLYGSFAAAGGVLMSRTVAFVKPANSKTIDAKAFHASRRSADLPLSRVAYIEPVMGRRRYSSTDIPSTASSGAERWA